MRWHGTRRPPNQWSVTRSDATDCTSPSSTSPQYRPRSSPSRALATLLLVDHAAEGDLPQPHQRVEVTDVQCPEIAAHAAPSRSPGAGGQVQGEDPQPGQPAA